MNNDKLSGFLQTSLILTAMAALFALVGYKLFGASALIFAGIFGIGITIAAPKLSPRMLLSSGRVRELEYQDAPRLYAAVAELAKRARLPEVPRLGYIRSPIPNAFTVGGRQDSAIIISEALVNRLSLREMTAVLAHEIAHIRNGDLRLIALADTVRRITSFLSRAGLLFLFFSLPLYLFSPAYSFPGLLILVLLAAPTLSMLLQFALSRGREYNADAGASELTGDPLGLASALQTIAYPQRIFLGYFFPVRREEERSMFRTHPPTEERVRRLETLARVRS
jgi:heat shock protein HtpX